MNEIKNDAAEEYLRVIKFDFEKYKQLGDKTFEQLSEDDFYSKTDKDSNSIAILIQHISGNFISRFSDFFTSDGEKPTRHRDKEFEEQKLLREELIVLWNNGWKVLSSTIDSLTSDDLIKTIYIRKEPHSVIQALNRSLSHFAYHVGQIVFLAKQIKKNNWKTLSVPKGKSEEFNKMMFEKK